MVKKAGAVKKSERPLAPALIFSFFTAVALTLVQFALVSSVMCRVDVSPNLLGPLSTIMVCISALAAGTALAFSIGSKGMLLGFAEGAVFYLILMGRGIPPGEFRFYQYGVCQAGRNVRRGGCGRLSRRRPGGAKMAQALRAFAPCAQGRGAPDPGIASAGRAVTGLVLN